MRSTLASVVACWSTVGACAIGQSPHDDIESLIEFSCIHCHDAGTETGLNFEDLGFDLTQIAAYRQWERVYDRVANGEMPPETEPRPDPTQVKNVLRLLNRSLREANLNAQRTQGRVPLRRLTALEYEYTLQDLLSIDEDLAGVLPAEADSGGFDTVGRAQGMSPVHIRSYLQAADLALDAAIQLGRQPNDKVREVDYLDSDYVNSWHDKPLNQGGSVTLKLDDAVVLFLDLDYIMRSDSSGLHIRTAGKYRITIEAYAYEANTPVTLKLILASEQRGGAELLGAWDLDSKKPRTVEVVTTMRPGDYIYPSVDDLDHPPGRGIYLVGGAKEYEGEGIAIKSMLVEGPLYNDWPPASTRALLTGMRFDERGDHFEVVRTKRTTEHVREISERIAPLAFRRPATQGEIDSFVELARPAIRARRPFKDVIRLPLRALLSSPQFLYFGGKPGQLNDYALAERLSYFLHKTAPDERLRTLARRGRLSSQSVLKKEVDRLLDDEKSQRFVRDFLGQWLNLYDIDLTTPDKTLYPEYDDVLRQAMLKESKLFFAELIKEDLPVRNLIDSDFTFVNRRLAKHYGIDDVQGQEFRKVTLPRKSPRGGILTHASVLKVTANGTVTSPVMRGNFVLTNLLGTPPNPPPPSVGSIEPDTRGTTTIRETLDAHRNTKECAACHQHIDPPGFALESFDPIGGFRTRYRSTGGREIPPFIVESNDTYYQQGPRVDASGKTADGNSFNGIDEYKQLLLDHEDKIAQHFISQLVVYATGSEIQFADRERIDEIIEHTRSKMYPVRTIIHELVQSDLFRNK